MKTSKSALQNIGRLLKRADFLRVQSTGQKWVTPHFIIQVMPADFCRLGLTITKKIFKLASDRNRVRRRIRALIYDVLAENAPKYDIVILPRVTSIKAPRENLKKDLEWALRRLSERGKDPKKGDSEAKNHG
jgi:ribonuclease P protein component